jgi:hypothetical protein
MKVIIFCIEADTPLHQLFNGGGRVLHGVAHDIRVA